MAEVRPDLEALGHDLVLEVGGHHLGPRRAPPVHGVPSMASFSGIDPEYRDSNFQEATMTEASAAKPGLPRRP